MFLPKKNTIIHTYKSTFRTAPRSGSFGYFSSHIPTDRLGSDLAISKSYGSVQSAPRKSNTFRFDPVPTVPSRAEPNGRKTHTVLSNFLEFGVKVFSRFGTALLLDREFSRTGSVRNQPHMQNVYGSVPLFYPTAKTLRFGAVRFSGTGPERSEEP